MSLNIALQTATSGLQAAQAGLSAVSDNIANVNTPGYVRKQIIQEQQVVAGRGAGVDVTGVQRITNQYLQSASLAASADSSRYSIVSQFLDNAQALFGDPSTSGYFFGQRKLAPSYNLFGHVIEGIDVAQAEARAVEDSKSRGQVQ